MAMQLTLDMDLPPRLTAEELPPTAKQKAFLRRYMHMAWVPETRAEANRLIGQILERQRERELTAA